MERNKQNSAELLESLLDENSNNGFFVVKSYNTGYITNAFYFLSQIKELASFFLSDSHSAIISKKDPKKAS